MPTLPGDQPHSRHFFPDRPLLHMRTTSYQPSTASQISPLSSSDNDSTSSMPASPSHKSHHARQLRPLYMPAVLRPNNEFSVPSKTAAPGSSPGNGSESSGAITLRRSSNNLLVGIGQRLSRRSTADDVKGMTGCLDLELFPQVTDLPTRKHWKPDPESSICDDPTCKRNFSYFTRRHHCRKCGNIFCDSHSSYVAPLDQHANFNPRAVPSRTCNHCFEEFKTWHSRNSSRTSSTTSSDGHPTSATAPMTAVPDVSRGPANGAEVAASVPRDWNWSTF
ncbi:hypothetical protein S7711_02993 [Stachybotrys chartarum IBT 7711]|uniref:FYVE-type domain-containing protein n=1 Tax=Stachybotrys chartarum (strain CBS 109288 / IBT 7711) TaxID=1280523 RepID=A0A084APA3_STACB|nr:hypothetical protein S7711_02993 [Stachybotrys chartarum IBT 7711]KFA45383.1 hypothetical protein S40293_09804 [Stachybotrys chartarum IBT 40293]KFA75001.1 hypothetical protein S40288_02208 [Stachybotrys chartarum IBT 40288]